MTDNTRRIIVTENEVEISSLRKNNWNLHGANCVVKPDNSKTWNTVWISRPTVNNVVIEWKPIYALNFTTQRHSGSIIVDIMGNWQPCSPGEVYDIEKDGSWKASTNSAPKPGFIKVGKVLYNFEGEGIHIILGIFDAGTKAFVPIFVDPVALPPNSSASFQPVDTPMLWFGPVQRTGTPITGDGSGTVLVNFENVQEPTAFNAIYSYASGTWKISPAPFDVPTGPTDPTGGSDDGDEVGGNE